MPFFTETFVSVRAILAAGAVALAVGAAPAVAGGDDGYEPIWKGVGGIVGLTKKDKQDPIDYHERARLVLPPKIVLPAPGQAAARNGGAWPVDPDLAKVRKERDATRQIQTSQSDLQAMRDGNRLSPMQLRGDHVNPGDKDAKRNCSAFTNQRGCDWIPFRNVFESVGLVKEADVVGGQEPDRDWLTDPPKGYRRATKSTTATFDAKKSTYDGDPRSALYHPPEQ